MASLSQALRLEDLPSSHSAFQDHAAHIIEWPIMLRPKDSEGTCLPSGVPTFLQAASRRNPRSDSSAPSDSCEDIGTFVGLSLPSSPLPFAFLTGLPCAQCRTQTEWLRWRVAEGPVPALGLPRLPPGSNQVDLEPNDRPSDAVAIGPYSAQKSSAGSTG
jgi:hypothetical protein